MPFCIADCQIVLFKIIVHIMTSFVGFFFHALVYSFVFLLLESLFS